MAYDHFKKRLRIIRIQVVREVGEDYSTTQPVKIKGAQDVFEIAQECGLGDASVEVVMEVLLSAKNEVIGVHEVSRGILEQSLLHQREAFKAALIANAYAVIFIHNHPSGDVKPSESDRATTKKLLEAGHFIGIKVLDHVIVSDTEYHSMRDNGDWGFD